LTDASPPATASFASRLLAWWDVHGRKDLPWQHPRTPYRVWVSEIMLQQTQVSTVIDYFQRFEQRFPDLPSLATAPVDDVLAAWAGLGYYARARNLHQAAQTCMAEFAGDLPAEVEQLVSLPGIGLSTANAIVSQTQDVPATVLDGNVKRVMARHAAVGGWPGKPAVTKQLLAAADARLTSERGADYTQAIMDLGATLCTRSKPACPACPVRADCRALAAGTVAQYPASKPKAGVPEKVLYMLVLRNFHGEVLLERRPPTGIWGGMWSLPEAGTAQAVKARFGVRRATELPGFDHRLSHRLLKIRPLLAKALPKPGAVADTDDLRWQAIDSRKDLGLAKPIEDILKRINEP
jgi:A/G-specific adenine glycosylase